MEIAELKKAFYKRDNWYIVTFIIIILAYHLIMREYYGDSVSGFSHLLEGSSWIEILKQRYTTWSSRLIIEIPLIFFSTNLKMELWSICNIAMYIILFTSLFELMNYKNALLIICLILLYPVIEMGSAGWIATYMNYFWPLSTGMFCFASLNRIVNGKKLSVLRQVVTSIFLLFSTNIEQFVVIYLCVLSLAFLFVIISKKRKRNIYIFIGIEYSICFFNLILALASSGKSNRVIIETETWMKDFPSLSLVDKLVMGVNSTMSMSIDSNILFFVFIIFLLFLVLTFKKKRLYLPTIFLTVFILFRTFFKNIALLYFPYLHYAFNNISNRGRIDSMTYMIPANYLPFILYMIAIIFILLILLNIFNDAKMGLFLFFIYLIGLISRLIMGFSPTLYASDLRTFLFYDFAIVFIILKINKYVADKHLINISRLNVLYCGIYILTGISILSNFAAICSHN